MQYSCRYSWCSLVKGCGHLRHGSTRILRSPDASLAQLVHKGVGCDPCVRLFAACIPRLTCPKQRPGMDFVNRFSGSGPQRFSPDTLFKLTDL